MRNLVFFCIAASMITSCFRAKEPDTTKTVITDEQAFATQHEVNRFFHASIIPAIDSAWNMIPDSGKSVTYHYIYLRKDSVWQFNRMERQESNLTMSNDSLALAIMSQAVMRTSFPVEERLARDSVLHLYWNWPVPFPEGEFNDATGEFIARQNNGGSSGGCDGRGTRAHCTMCGANDDCPLVCVGYMECENKPGICSEAYACASGGPFGRGMVNVIQ